MICTKCSNSTLVRDTRDLSYGSAQGRATTIHGVTGDYCSSCGEVHLDMSELFSASASKSWPRGQETQRMGLLGV
jgi:YgiT-type zinc finger domain-containing protein